MDTKALNSRKKEILDQQTQMLTAALTNKVKLTATENEKYEALTAELNDVDVNIARFENINKGNAEVGSPRENVIVADAKKAAKFYAFSGGYAPKTEVNPEYAKNFWASLRSKSDFDRFQIQNAALGETGSTAAGGALVPIETDPSIPNLQIEETIARSLSRVITTQMDINVPYQAAKTTAALKTESSSSGTHAFAENDPTFATTKLSAYLVGGQVTASWELLQDAKAAADFITADLARAIRVKEENYFVNGSGSSQPQGYLSNATTATGVDVTAGAATLAINPLLDTAATLNRAYYGRANWLVNRSEFNRLLKKQIAASQYQTYVTWDADGSARLLGYPVAFSAEMPSYSASPSVTGSWLFGDFSSYAVIGDRGDANIKIKVLDQIQALNGQTVIVGYRRLDQRIILQEACVQLNTNG